MKKIVLLAASLVVVCCLAVAQSNIDKSTGAVVMLPAQASPVFVEGERDQLHLPGPEYRSGDGWWAFSCKISCQLQPVKLAVSAKPHPQYDGDPVPGQVLRFTPASTDLPLMYFKPFRAPATTLRLQAGPVTTYYPGAQSRLKPAKNTKGTMESEINLPDGQTARLVPTSLLPPKNTKTEVPGQNVLVLDLVIGNKRQSLDQFRFGLDGNTAVKATEFVRWAGDLDGDGHLDLLVQYDYGGGTVLVLYLSSMAGPDQLVGEAGRFTYYAIDVAGC
ncbi:FG-GAP repeat protein [Undibacterium sp. Ji50W]|uniref:FG-GAP repeat protein n=1 Tax=Undibacterium TaxID=401469 RepID=UPI003BF0152B